MSQGGINSFEVLLYNGFTAFTVSLFNCVFYLFNGFFAGKTLLMARSKLHDCINSATHASLFGNFIGIDDKEHSFLLIIASCTS
jgi:hypothetical protein